MSFEPMFNSGGWLLVAVVAVLLAAALAWSARWLLPAGDRKSVV